MFLGFMSITHAAIAAAGTSLIIGTADPMALGLAILGSQLPDIDTTTSTIGKIFFPLSSFIEDRFPHRSITHSLLATAFIAAIALPIGYFLGNWFTAIALRYRASSSSWGLPGASSSSRIILKKHIYIERLETQIED